MTDNEYAIFSEFNCAPIGLLIECNFLLIKPYYTLQEYTLYTGI